MKKQEKISRFFVVTLIIATLFGCNSEEKDAIHFYNENKEELEKLAILFHEQYYLSSFQIDLDDSTLGMVHSFDSPESEEMENQVRLTILIDKSKLSANSIDPYKRVSLQAFCRKYSIPIETIQFYYDFLINMRIYTVAKRKGTEIISINYGETLLFVYSKNLLQSNIPTSWIEKRLSENWYLVKGEL